MRAIRITTAPTAPPIMGPGLVNGVPDFGGEGSIDGEVVDVVVVLVTVMEGVTVAINVHSRQEAN